MVSESVEIHGEIDLVTVLAAAAEAVHAVHRMAIEDEVVVAVPVRQAKSYVHADESVRCTGMFRHQVCIRFTVFEALF